MRCQRRRLGQGGGAAGWSAADAPCELQRHVQEFALALRIRYFQTCAVHADARVEADQRAIQQVQGTAEDPIVAADPWLRHARDRTTGPITRIDGLRKGGW